MGKVMNENLEDVQINSTMSRFESRLSDDNGRMEAK